MVCIADELAEGVAAPVPLEPPPLSEAELVEAAELSFHNPKLSVPTFVSSVATTIAPVRNVLP